MRLIFDYLKENVKFLVVCAIIYCTFLTVFLLSNLSLPAFSYAMLVSGFILFVMAVMDFIRYRRKSKLLASLINSILITTENMPLPDGRLEEEYQSLILLLHSNITDIKSKMSLKIINMTDYYTMWVHQIKTPISAMRLILQNSNDSDASELSAQLLKIEQYVEMVLAYIRMDGDTTDYVFRKCNLEKIVKQSVRKYAQLFIRKKIPVDIHNINITVVSDEKWLAFVIGQILSNAVKYSDKGKISIYIKEENVLVIEDKGVGIAKADLPRIFDKGFTGYNGRADKSATGIGLYLSKQILNKLGHKITVISQIGVGTKVMIDLSREEFTFE